MVKLYAAIRTWNCETIRSRVLVGPFDRCGVMPAMSAPLLLSDDFANVSLENTPPTCPDVSTDVRTNPEWDRLAQLVERIRAGEQDAIAELYAGSVGRGVRALLAAKTGPHGLDDRVHDVLLIVIEAIRNGKIRDPHRILGYVSTVVRYRTMQFIKAQAVARRREVIWDEELPICSRDPNAEARYLESEKVMLMQKALGCLNERDREILRRFYLHEQTPTVICAQMGLTTTQFRLFKSRAKARLAKETERLLRQRRSQPNYDSLASWLRRP